MSRSKTLQNEMYPSYFVFGAVILYSLLFVLPSIYGVIVSFTDWSLVKDISTIQFVGLENYAKIFSPEENYFKYIGNTLFFAIVTSVAKSVIALGVALLLQKGIFGKNFHRMSLFFPSIISVVVTGLVFRSIMRPNTGLFNVILSSMPFFDGKTDWLNNPATALACVMAVDIWRGVGYIMIIYLAGLQSIPADYYEAASIDGAGYIGKFLNVTLPMLKQTILLNFMLNLIYGLRVFDMVYVLTRGGPGDLTDVLNTSVFREFGKGNFALGSALSSVMLVVLLIFGLFSIRFITKQEVEN
jgi:raffinose/stachyose/melibiose transport system permease protein